MARYASGKNAYGISDRSGFRYRLRDMREEWNGLLVGYDEFEEKHPQLEPSRVVADDQALRNPRPDTRNSIPETVQIPIFDMVNLVFTETPRAKALLGEVTVSVS